MALSSRLLYNVIIGYLDVFLAYNVLKIIIICIASTKWFNTKPAEIIYRKEQSLNYMW